MRHTYTYMRVGYQLQRGARTSHPTFSRLFYTIFTPSHTPSRQLTPKFRRISPFPTSSCGVVLSLLLLPLSSCSFFAFASSFSLNACDTHSLPTKMDRHLWKRVEIDDLSTVNRVYRTAGCKEGSAGQNLGGFQADPVLGYRHR